MLVYCVLRIWHLKVEPFLKGEVWRPQKCLFCLLWKPALCPHTYGLRLWPTSVCVNGQHRDAVGGVWSHISEHDALPVHRQLLVLVGPALLYNQQAVIRSTLHLRPCDGNDCWCYVCDIQHGSWDASWWREGKKVLNRVPEDLELQSVMKLVDVEVNSYKALKSKLNRIKSNECKLTIQWHLFLEISSPACVRHH